MAELPSHPETDRPVAAAGDPATGSGSRRGVLLIAVAVLAVVLLVVLHVTGVLGPEGH